MKRKFTLLIAALALLTMMATTGEMWGQSDYSTDYTGNITLSPSGGTSASACKVNINNTEYDGIKAGASQIAGAVKITVPSGTKYLHLHLAAWNNETVTLTVTPTGYSGNIALTNNIGISNNSPFLFNGDPSTSDYYKVITFTSALTANTDLTFTATGGKRFVVWGVNSEEEGSNPPSSDPTITLSDSGTGNIGNYAVNTEITRDFTVTQSNLTDPISLSATNDGTFTINNEPTNSIPAGDGSTVVTWHFTPTATGQFTSEITATSGETSATCTYMGYAFTSHNVNITQGIHGTVEADPTSGIQGTYITLTATPDQGYELEELTVLDGNNNEIEVNDLNRFQMPDSDVTISATFVEASPTTIVTDELTYSLIGVTGTNYSNWSNKTSVSDAVYAGQSAGGNSSIQLRATSPAGIISTTSGGKVKKVTVTWNSNTSGRILDIYGSNTAYTASSELYSSTTQGTKLGSISSDNNAPLNITSDYAYIGLRSKSSAMYIDKIEIDWAVSATTVANPTITPNGGAIDFTQSITLACSTDEANIYYTTDGNDPIVGTTTQLYSEPFTISEACTVKAIAAKEGMDPSEIVSASFTQAQVATPTFSLDGGTYFGEQEVTISCTTAGATIFYSIDGGEPNLTYENAITISSSCTLKAKATKTGCLPSELAQAQYTIEAGYETIFSQDWEGEMNGWTFVNVLGDQQWSISSSSGTTNYAKMSGYASSSNNANEDWIISPAFNLNEWNNATLSFVTAKNYNGNNLQVFFSNDYDGSDPTSATWNELTCTLSSGSWTWTESGNISLSSYSGTNCYIGFKYTSTTSAAATWEVDDILLVGQESTTPMITADLSAMSFTYEAGASGSAASQALAIVGSHLTATIAANITQGADKFSISDDEETWATSLSLPLAGDVIAVRLNPGITTPGTYNGTITLTSTGADPVTVNLTGTVTNHLYSVLLSQPVAGGTIEADKETAQEGETVTLSYTAVDGFVFGSWAVEDENENPITVDGNNQFTMPASDVIVTATFSALPTYTITTVANPAAGGTVVTDETAWEGKEVTVLVEANEGYALETLTATYVDGGSISHDITITNNTFVMPAYPVTVTATFVVNLNVTYDFSTAENFYTEQGGSTHPGTGSANNVDEFYYGNGDYFTTSRPTNGSSYFSNGYFMLGKSGALLNLPTFTNYNVTSIVLHSSTGHSISVKVAIVNGNNTVANEQTWNTQNNDYTYDIPKQYQNSALSVKVTNTYNTQITSITLVRETISTDPELTTENVSIASNATAGEITFTLVNPVEGGNLTAEITAGNEDDWLSLGTLGETQPFTCTANDGDERTATVTFTYTYNNSKESISASAIVTQAEYVAPAATITYHFNNIVNEVPVYSLGETELATPTTTINGYTFVGWTTEPIEGVSSSATYFMTYNIQNNIDFYAVLAIASFDGYEQITSVPLTSGTYVLAAKPDDDYRILSGKDTSGSNHFGTGEAVEAITMSNVGENVITIAESTNGYSMLFKNEYLEWNSGNSLAFSSSLNPNNGEWTFVMEGEYVEIANVNSSDRKLQWNNSSPRFACYTTAQTKVMLFKQIIVFSNFCTTVSDPAIPTAAGGVMTEDYTIDAGAAYTLTEPIIVPDGVTLTVNGTLGNAYENYLIIKDGGQLIHTNELAATLQKNITAASSWKDDVDGWYFIASPVDGAVITESFTISPSNAIDLFRYDEPSAYWMAYWDTPSFANMVRGSGYLHASQTAQTVNFAGEMINTEHEFIKPLSYECGYADLIGFNLVGNPFTRNLVEGEMTIGDSDLTLYYGINDETTGMEVKEIDEIPIKPGQGFFVQATSTNQDLIISPSKKGETVDKGCIRIAAGNDDYMDKAYIQIKNGNTLRKMNIANSTKVYVMNGDDDYAATRVEELAGAMPVNFKAIEDGTYTITVETKNIDAYYLHLIDNFTNEDIDLLLEPTYTFTANADDVEGRFRLVFDFNDYTGIEENNTNSNFVYQFGNEILVNGEGTLQVFDVMGRLVTSFTVNGNERLSTSQLNTGVYIFRMVESEVKTQKIVVR